MDSSVTAVARCVEGVQHSEGRGGANRTLHRLPQIRRAHEEMCNSEDRLSLVSSDTASWRRFLTSADRKRLDSTRAKGGNRSHISKACSYPPIVLRREQHLASRGALDVFPRLSPVQGGHDQGRVNAGARAHRDPNIHDAVLCVREPERSVFAEAMRGFQTG
jgi:hypothetical protein